jgi:hypothetical protein
MREEVQQTPLWMWVVGPAIVAVWSIAIAVSFVFLAAQFLGVAAVSGAAGGLVVAISHLQRFARTWWRSKDETYKGPVWCPRANLLLKPVFWPLAGAVVGTIAVALFYDSGTDLLRVGGLAGASGIGWLAIAQKFEKD